MMTTYRNVTFVTVLASLTVNQMIPAGTRCIEYPADGTNYVTPAPANVRGTYITEGDVYPTDNGVAAVETSKGGDFFCVVAAGVSFAYGDPVYAAANGQVSSSNANGAAYMGTARETFTIGVGTYVGVSLKSVP